MAISEYAPGCEIVAAGNLIRSRYIKKVPNKNWREYDYVQCNKCKTLNIELHHDVKDEQSIDHCAQCGEKFHQGEIKTFLIPEFGFAAEPKIEKPSLIKPDRTYRTEASMVSRGNTTYQGEFSVGSLLVNTVSMEDGEIAILNKSDFYVCPSCGYTLSSMEANAFTNNISREHHNSSGYKCKNTNLRRISLGYRFKTDALSISLNETFEFDEAYSILQAIILSACKSLNIDNSEIAGCLQYAMKDFGPTYDFIIYDTTPGGAGHVRRFADKDSMTRILKEAYNRANSCDCGGKDADTSCYKCLRTYQNQLHHDIIKRSYVINRLSKSFIVPEKDIDITQVKTPNTKKVQSKTIKLSAFPDTTVANQSYDYIVSYLDLNNDENEIKIAETMRDKMVDKPDYGETDFTTSIGENGYADLIWLNKKTMVFRPGNEGSYKVAQNSNYRCFLFDDSLNVEEFIEAIS